MEQGAPATPQQQPQQPEFSLKESLQRALAEERGEEWRPPSSEPAAEAPAPQSEPSESAPGEASEAQSEPASEQEPTGQPATAEVEIDGRTYVVPAELKDGYLRQADYTKKTQEIAERGRAVEAQKQSVEQAFQVAQQLGPLLAEFSNAQKAQESYGRIDWNALYQADPALHNKTRLEAQENYQRLNELGTMLQRAPSALQAMQAQAFDQRLKDELPKARKLVPDFESRRAELQAAGKHYGFGDDELIVTDARVIHALSDLAKYHAILKKSAEVKQQVQSAPPVAKPGTKAAAPQASAKDYNAAVRNLRTDGSDDAFVEALRLKRKLKG